MKKLIVLLIFAPQLLWAAPVTEFIFQADEGAHMVRPELNTAFGTEEDSATPNQKTDTTNFGIDVEYQYGLSNNHSLGAELGFSTISTEVGATSTDASGLNDLGLIYRGRLPFEDTTWTMRWGADVSLALANAKIDANQQRENTASGRTVFTPYIGMDTTLAKIHTLGVRLNTQFALSDRTVEMAGSTTDMKFEGGESTNLDVYWEMDNDTWKVVGIVGYQTVSDTKWATTFGTNAAGTVNEKGPDFLNIRAMAPIYLTETSAILPTVAYSTVINDNTAASDVTNNVISITGAYRTLF